MNKHFLLPVALIAGLGYFLQDQGLHADESTVVVPDRDETVVNQNIQAWLAKPEKERKVLFYPGRSWVKMKLRDALERAKQANLELQRSALAVSSAREAWKETEASRFDTILSASGGYSHSETLDRTEQDLKYKKATTRCPQAALLGVQASDNVVLDESGDFGKVIKVGERDYKEGEALENKDEAFQNQWLGYGGRLGDNILFDEYGSLSKVIRFGEPGYREEDALAPNHPWACLGDENGNDRFHEKIFTVFSPASPVRYVRIGSVDDEQVANPRPEGYFLRKEVASTANPKGSSKIGTLSFSLSKALPWGVDVSLNEQTTYREAQWILNEGSSEPIVGSYDRPWTSSLSASAALPVPGGKNFGQYAERDAAVALAALDQKRSQADVRMQTNDLLHGVQTAFWDLVGGVRTLDATIENWRTVKQLADKTRTLLHGGLKTVYEMAQMDSEQERVYNQAIIAWNDYVILSDELSYLLNLDPSVWIIPTGYMASLAEFPKRALGADLETGSRDNPRLQAEAINVAQAELNVLKSETQTRPDISLNASASAVQSGALFGHDSLDDSLTNLVNPDRISVSAGVAYRYPWKNQYALARQEQAHAQKAMSALQRRAAGRQVVRRITNAHVAMDSALRRIHIADRRLKLTRESYHKSLQRRDDGLIAEYEVLVKSGDVLVAEKQFILALVDAKKADTALLSAMGSLGQNDPLVKEYGP